MNGKGRRNSKIEAMNKAHQIRSPTIEAAALYYLRLEL